MNKGTQRQVHGEEGWDEALTQELAQHGLGSYEVLRDWMADTRRQRDKERAIKQAVEDARRQIRNAAHSGPESEANLVDDADDEIDRIDTPESINDDAHPRNNPAHPDHISWRARWEMLHVLAFHEPGSLPADEPLPRDPVTWTALPDETSQAGGTAAGPSGAPVASFGAATDLLRGLELGSGAPQAA